MAKDKELQIARLLRKLDESVAGEGHFSAPELGELSDEQRDEFHAARNCLAVLDQLREFESRSTQGHEAAVTYLGDRHFGTEEDIPVPNQFGRFQIKRLLGQGGFARVYLANDPVLERDVALKIPKPHSLANEDARERFKREGKAAAILDHPAIVPVYEASAVGPVPYISLGFCPGETLANWKNRQTGDVAPRLAVAIILPLAQALSHAHARGIVHRDIKPGNVLIDDDSEDSGIASRVPRVRITDFGLVKYELENQVADGPLTDGPLTHDGAIVGTPAYMSPEQASADHEIGAATDVFSLGAVLFELLVGRPPHQRGTHMKTLKSIELEDPPSIRSLRRDVPKDLEAIVLKSLQKRPKDRYATAFDFAQDLENWSSGNPVNARPITAVRRAFRVAGRNPIPTIAIAVALCGLTIGLCVALWQWKNAEEKSIIAAAAGRVAAFESERAQDSFETLIGSFESIDPFASGSANISAKQVLVNTRKQIEQKFQQAPETKVKLLAALARSFTGLGDYESARECRIEIYDLLSGTKGEAHLETLDALREWAIAEHNSGNLKESLELREKHLDLTRNRLGPTHPDTIFAMSSVGKTYFQLGQIRKAIDLHEQTSVIQEFANNREVYSPSVATNLAEVYQRMKLLNQAIAINRKELEFCQKTLGLQNSSTLAVMASLAGALRANRQYDEAIAMQTRVVDICTEEFGRDDPTTLKNLDLLAYCYGAAGQTDEALTTIKTTVRLSNERLGEDHPQSISYLNRLGQIHRWRQEYDQAINAHELALEACRRELGSDDYRTIAILLELAGCYRRTGEIRTAIKYTSEAVDLANRQVGPNHLLTIEANQDLGRCYYLAYEPGKAAEVHGRALAVLERELGKDHTNVNYARRLYSFALLSSGQNEIARKIALDWFESSKRRKSVVTRGIARNILAIAQIELGDIEGAEKTIRPALRRKRFGFPARAMAQTIYGIAAAKRGNQQETNNFLVEPTKDLIRNLDDLRYPHQRQHVSRCIEFVQQSLAATGTDTQRVYWAEEKKRVEERLRQIENEAREISGTLPE